MSKQRGNIPKKEKTSFSLTDHNGRKMMGFEADIRDGYEKFLLQTDEERCFGYSDSPNAKRSLEWGDKVWNGVKSLDEKSLKQAVLSDPWALYHNKRALTEIVRQTLLAIHSIDEGERNKAMRWVEMICTPWKAGDWSKRPNITTTHISVFSMLYTDVIIIRGAYQAMHRDVSASLKLRKIEEIFDVSGLNSSKLRMVCDRTSRLCVDEDLPDASDEPATPIRVALQLLSECIGYKRRKTYSEITKYYRWSEMCAQDKDNATKRLAIIKTKYTDLLQ